MKKLVFYGSLWFSLVSGAFGQGFFWSLPSQFPNTTIRVCPISTANPCPTPSNIFSDVGLGSAVLNPSNIGPGGGFGFFAAAGQYTVFLGAPSFRIFQVNLGGSGGGGAAFNAITSGTNTTAAMLCGTGCSITPSGTGTIGLPTTGTTVQISDNAGGQLLVDSFPAGGTGNIFATRDIQAGRNLIATTSTLSPVYKGNTCPSPIGTSANPSLVACVNANSGVFSCAVAASTGTCVVSTTAVSAASTIIVQQSDADGATIGVTCNTGVTVSATAPLLASKSAGVSFTINLGTVSVNPACFTFFIIN